MIGTTVAVVIQNGEANLEACHFVRVLCDLGHFNRTFPDTNATLNHEDLQTFILSSSFSSLLLLLLSLPPLLSLCLFSNKLVKRPRYPIFGKVRQLLLTKGHMGSADWIVVI